MSERHFNKIYAVFARNTIRCVLSPQVKYAYRCFVAVVCDLVVVLRDASKKLSLASRAFGHSAGRTSRRRSKWGED